MLLTVLVPLVALASAYPSCMSNPGYLDGVMSRAVAALDQAGFEVAYGNVSFKNSCTPQAVTCFGLMWSCGGVARVLLASAGVILFVLQH